MKKEKPSKKKESHEKDHMYNEEQQYILLYSSLNILSNALYIHIHMHARRTYIHTRTRIYTASFKTMHMYIHDMI